MIRHLSDPLYKLIFEAQAKANLLRLLGHTRWEDPGEAYETIHCSI